MQDSLDTLKMLWEQKEELCPGLGVAMASLALREKGRYVEPAGLLDRGNLQEEGKTSGERLLEKRYHRQAYRLNHTKQQVVGNKGKTPNRVKEEVEEGLEKVLKHHTTLSLMASAYSLVVFIL